MANPSLQIGNSNWAIKEDDLLGYSTVGTNYLPKPMTMTRESAGTRVNSEGLVETVELLGSEQVPSIASIVNGSATGTSEIVQISGNSYSAESDGTNSSTIRPKFNLATTSGKGYKLTITPTGSITGTIACKFYDGSSYLFTDYDFTTVKEIYFTDNGSVNLSFNGQNTFSVASFTLSIKESTKNNLARVDYTDGTSSLLAEPERTNLIQYSEDFSQSYWILTSASVSLSTTTSPDGLSTSYKLIPDNGTGGNRSISKQFNGLSNNHTHTCFAKKGEYNYLMLRMRNSPNVGVMFDLENGTLNLNNPGAPYVDSEIQSIGNGWYKCSITLDPSQSVSVGQMYISMSVGITGSETHSFNGDGISGIYIWGCGFEEGSYATSYIPTDDGTVTRVKERYTKTGISDLINSEEGSFFVDIAALNQPPGSQLSISLSGDNSNDRILIYTGSGGGEWVTQFRKDATSYVTIKKSTTITNQSKVAVSWESGKYLMYIDGIKATNYTAGSETEATTFDLGDLKNLQFSPNHNSTSNFFYGKVKQLQVYKTALTDSELETLTT